MTERLNWTYSSILAWRIPRTEDPGRLQFRVRHDWMTKHDHSTYRSIHHKSTSLPSPLERLRSSLHLQLWGILGKSFHRSGLLKHWVSTKISTKTLPYYSFELCSWDWCSVRRWKDTWWQGHYKSQELEKTGLSVQTRAFTASKKWGGNWLTGFC